MLVIVEEIAPLPTCFLLHLPVPLTRPPRVTLRVKVAFPLVRVVCPYSLNVPLITPLPLQVPAGKPGFAAAWPAGAAAPSAATAAAVRKSFLNFMLPPWDLVRLNDSRSMVSRWRLSALLGRPLSRLRLVACCFR